MAEKIEVIAVLRDSLSGPMRVIAGAFGSVRRVASTVTSTILGFARSIFSLQSAVVAFVTGFAVRRVLQAAGEVEEKVKEIGTLLGEVSEDTLAKLSQDIRRAAVEGGQAFADEFRAAYDAISAGVDADKLIEFLRVANQLAVGGVTTVSESVDLLTSTLNAYGVSVDRARDFSDILFKTVEGGKTTISELAQSIFQVAPAAAAAGVPLEQVGASLAALTAAGTPTRVAATNLRAALIELGKAGTQANKEFVAVAGKGFREFIAAGGTLADAMTLLRARAESSGKAISDLFGSVEGGLAVQVLAGKGFDALVANMDRMASRSGATQRAFELMSSSFNFATRQLRAAFGDLIVEIANRFLPSLTDAVQKVTAIVRTLTEALRGDEGARALGVQVLVALRQLLVEVLGGAFPRLIASTFVITLTAALHAGLTSALPLARQILIDWLASLINSVSNFIVEQFHKDPLLSSLIFGPGALLAAQQFRAPGGPGVDISPETREAIIEAQQRIGEIAQELMPLLNREWELFQQAVTGSVQPFNELLAKISETAQRVEEELVEPITPGGKTDAETKSFFERLQERARVALESINIATISIAQSFSSGLASALVDFASGVQTASEAFRQFAAQFLRQIAQMILQALILKALTHAFPGFFGASEGGLAQGFAEGGPVYGPRVHRDIVPARLSPGEFVQPERTVEYYGASVMEALRRRLIPRSVLTGFGAPSPRVIGRGSFQSGGGVDRGRPGVAPPPLAVVVGNDENVSALLRGGGGALLEWMRNHGSDIRVAIGAGRG